MACLFLPKFSGRRSNETHNKRVFTGKFGAGKQFVCRQFSWLHFGYTSPALLCIVVQIEQRTSTLYLYKSIGYVEKFSF